MLFLQKRQPGYALLAGRGLEVGAFEHPAKLPPSCTVEYCDRITTEEAAQLFPEVNSRGLPQVRYVLDLDTQGLQQFPQGTYDFVVFNHVIEHLVNPMQALVEIFRVLRPGGRMAIAAPDKDYTFDRRRPLTPFARLQARYEQRATAVTPWDYYEIAQFIHPELLRLSKQELVPHLQGFQNRREHLSVWTSESFRQFLTTSFARLKLRAKPLYEVIADENGIEYFGVWEQASDDRQVAD